MGKIATTRAGLRTAARTPGLRLLLAGSLSMIAAGVAGALLLAVWLVTGNAVVHAVMLLWNLFIVAGTTVMLALAACMVARRP